MAGCALVKGNFARKHNAGLIAISMAASQPQSGLMFLPALGL